MIQLVIADDEKDIRLGLGEFFPWCNFGYEVVSIASNSMEVIDVLGKKKVDVLISDIKMPGMSGLELTAYIRRNYPHIQVVLLSGFKDFEYAQKAIELGVKRFLLKPTKLQELIETVENIKKDINAKYVTEESKQEDRYAFISKVNHPVIKLVVQHLNQHYKTASLEEVSNVVNMNASYLSTFFKEHTGVNFLEYLNHIRMVQAGRLLTTSNLKIYEICELVGYSNAKHFTKKFTAYYNLLPKEYRVKYYE